MRATLLLLRLGLIQKHDVMPDCVEHLFSCGISHVQVLGRPNRWDDIGIKIPLLQVSALRV